MRAMSKFSHVALTGLFIISVLACNDQSQKGGEQAADTVTVSKILDSTGQSTISADTALVPAGKLIIPGKTVGHISLGDDAATLETKLGKADFSDAAMGKAWITWYGKGKEEGPKRTELNIYTTYKDSTMSQKTVQQIRATSSFFMTADSVQVTSSLDKIRSAFLGLRKVGSYREEKSMATIIVYDDIAKGIAFEINEAAKQPVCTGIIIHKPGVNVLDTYIMLHPDMNRE